MEGLPFLFNSISKRTQNPIFTACHMRKILYTTVTAVAVFAASFLLCGILDNLFNCQIGLIPRKDLILHAICFSVVWAIIAGYRKYKRIR